MNELIIPEDNKIVTTNRPSEAAQQSAEAQQNEYNYQSTPENYDASMFDDQMPEDIPF